MAIKLSNLKESSSLTQNVEQEMPKVGVLADALELEIAPQTVPNEASPFTASRVALMDPPRAEGATVDGPLQESAPSSVHILIADERPKSQADEHPVLTQYPLGMRIYSVLFHFIRQIEGVKYQDNSISSDGLKALESFFEEMYAAFKRVRGLDSGLGFADFMREFFSKTAQHEQIKSYLQGRNISISTQEVKNRDHSISQHALSALERYFEEMYTVFKRVREIDAHLEFANFMRDFFSNSQDDLKALERSFEKMYTVFKRVREVDAELGFADFMREFFSEMGQHEQVKSYLTHWNIPIFAQEVENGDNSTSQDDLKALERFFEDMCAVFKRARECNNELEFADFMREFFSKISQHEQVKNYLIDHNISISAQEIENWNGFMGRHDLKALAPPFEGIYTVFKRARKLETELGFADFMRDFFLKMMECEQVKNYLKDRNISIHAYSNQNPKSKCSLGETPQICIRVGNFVQTAILCEDKVRLSRLQQVDRKEDTPNRFDATVWIFDPNDDDESRRLGVIQRLFRWLRMQIC